MDAVIAIETVAAGLPAQRRRGAGGQLRPDPRARRIRLASQKKRFLAPLLAGEAVISVGMTEPEAGSAVTDLKTSGERRTATATASTAARSSRPTRPYADVILTYVRFGPGVGGIGSVLIAARRRRLQAGQASNVHVGRGVGRAIFDDVHVPAEWCCSSEGGFKKQIAGFNVERIGNTARSLALGRYAYERARQWALQRKQFGRLLCEFQGLQWKFADMKIKLDAGAASPLPRRSQRRPRLSVGRGNRDRQGLLQPGRLRRRQRSAAGDGRPGLQPGELVEYCLRALPRLDDRRRLDRDPQEPHRRRRFSSAASRSGHDDYGSYL